MKPVTKTVLMGYAGSLGTALAIVIVTTIAMDPHDCPAAERTLSVLCLSLAVIWFISVLVMIRLSRQIGMGSGGKGALVSAYALVLLATYFVVTFMLMFVFNC
jgi:hypothetical protein